MELIIKEGNLTVSHEVLPNELYEVTVEQAMLAAYDVLSRIFGQRAVINAYYRTDPDTMAVRDEDDEFLKSVEFFGYSDRKED